MVVAKTPDTKIGVKVDRMPLPDRVSVRPPMAHHPITLDRAEDLRQAKQDCVSSITFCQRQIEQYESAPPEAARNQAERDYGAGTTVEEAIARNRRTQEDAEAGLVELADAPGAYEEDLMASLKSALEMDAAPVGQGSGFAEARSRFLKQYGDRDDHVLWLIVRSTVVADFYMQSGKVVAGSAGDSGWCSDGVWRFGGEQVVDHFDVEELEVEEPIVDMPEIFSWGDIRYQREALARRAVVLVRFHETSGDETRRARWTEFLNMERSALSQTEGCDKDFVPSNYEISWTTASRFEDELLITEAEDAAKLRSWEAVHALDAQLGPVDDEDKEWSSYLEKEAEETRQWVERRRGLFRQSRSHQPQNHSRPPRFLSRRTGARARSSACRTGRTRGSRRGGSKAAARGGGDPPGGGDPEPRRRRLGRSIIFTLLLFFVITGTGNAMTKMADFETRGPEFRYPSELPFAPLPDDAIPPLHPSWEAEDLQRLIDDPRQFEDEHDDDLWNLTTGPRNWATDVIYAILNRAVDEYNPANGYLCDNFGPDVGAALNNDQLRELLRAIDRGDLAGVDRLMEKINGHCEREALNFGCDSFDHCRARLLANGEIRILLDQRSARRMRHVSALKIQKTTRATSTAPLRVAKRTDARARSNGAAATRSRGSRRRTGSTSSGGGGSRRDDSGGEPEPAHSRRPSPLAQLDQLQEGGQRGARRASRRPTYCLLRPSSLSRWRITCRSKPAERVCRMVRAGQIPPGAVVRLGSTIRFRLESIEAFEAEGGKGLDEAA